ncbi:MULTISPECIES: LysR family transcriptional regulator [Salipiger]|jgi:LysR family nitrogen assimilation transcriptional regulator|uniref:LysR family transcriptional regulator, nitrogen assimilation regulatory protein n=1 Tax=Salipiger profundus TaxID=1229727 RepID=A0A1U7DA34_9RHOB|nr:MULTISPECIES: LysR family transcriptional regulator [Salipiger]APX24915.1 LysR family transcriptional regulator, nitrogen assimilation regulatory protein [Salipiger profundus]GFZ98820.1 LysR family transcriptional regulator [Salipiger profundus]SFC95244.1 LysR family transcriptional regulator, nitrogen assimilation regulatory protein [Salipiger profundus]
MSRHEKPGSNLNFKRLSYFLALAEHGSISAAANALNMAQPSLSENIAKLEDELGTKLAIRGARGVQMTEAGVALAKRGQEILNDVGTMIEEIRQIGGEPRGTLSIGLPPSLSILLSVPLLETIHYEFPQIKLHIAEAMSGDIIEWLNTDRIDLGCVYEAPDNISYALQPILTEEMFLVTAVDNWPGELGEDGVALEPISAAQLSELPLVLTSQTHGARKLQEKFARTIGVDLNVIAEIDSLPHIVEMVSRASAYTLLSHGAVMKQVAAGTLAMVPIKEPTIRRTAYLARSRVRPVTRARTAVESFILEIIAEMVDRYKLRAIVAEDLSKAAAEKAAEADLPPAARDRVA